MITIYATYKLFIYDNCNYVARIYKDKIVVTSPTVRWTGNTGSYHEIKEAIRDKSIVEAVRVNCLDDCIKSAWHKIGIALNNDYLENL